MLFRSYAPSSVVCPQPRVQASLGATPVLSSLPPTLTWKPPSVLSPFACCRGYRPPTGRRVPSPERTLLLRHRSYGLMRQTHLTLPSFGFSPRSGSLCRLLPAPAASGFFPTLSLKILPEMLDPVPRRSHRLHVPVSSSVSAAFPTKRLGRLPASFREYDFSRGEFRGCRYSFMFRPPSLLALQVVPTAAHTATGQPELLHPGISCFVTSARTGYANRLNTGN